MFVGCCRNKAANLMPFVLSITCQQWMAVSQSTIEKRNAKKKTCKNIFNISSVREQQFQVMFDWKNHVHSLNVAGGNTTFMPWHKILPQLLPTIFLLLVSILSVTKRHKRLTPNCFQFLFQVINTQSLLWFLLCFQLLFLRY